MDKDIDTPWPCPRCENNAPVVSATHKVSIDGISGAQEMRLVKRERLCLGCGHSFKTQAIWPIEADNATA